MKIIQQSHEIITPLNGTEILKHIERCGRVAYQSGDKITGESAGGFVRRIIQRGHESVLEHFSITVRFIADRAIANELVRHRLASFTQESTRYCKYDDLAVILPPDVPTHLLVDALCGSGSGYRDMIHEGVPAQFSRAVLPLCTKTELIMTANLREWRHVLKLRTANDAHPDMRRLMIPLLADLQAAVPVVFDDVSERNT
jgi:thymidylate synthase (FAD)